MMLKSIVKSQHIIGLDAVKDVTDTLAIPDTKKFANFSAEQLKQLNIT